MSLEIAYDKMEPWIVECNLLEIDYLLLEQTSRLRSENELQRLKNGFYSHGLPYDESQCKN